MAHHAQPLPDEMESRRVAEESRQKRWRKPSFLRELFLGKMRLDLIHPFPMKWDQERQEFKEFFKQLKELLEEKVDPIEIDSTGEYPPEIVDALRRLGAFGMKIAPEYGGLGFSQVEYCRIMELLGTYDGNLIALLSAHQSIGVPQPLKLFGSEKLKKKYLPRCAAGEISAFALTEHDVGSDPARLATTAAKTPEGDAYILDGVKLWCTNGTLAKFLVVMASDPITKKISAFVVETEWPGVTIEKRCHFMGLRALANAVIRFENVRIPAENLIGAEGKGLKIALTTLNDGRLSIPASTVGMVKRCIETCRTWASQRVQWGKPIGQHEAIAHKISDIAANAFAMESIAYLACAMTDTGKYDIRLEAAAAKEWNTMTGWRLIDETLQVRGGRGYETEASLAARGEKPIGIERAMRDFRINRIFEGSSEIMHLFMAREMVDKHLQVAGELINPKKSIGEKFKIIPQMVGFYATWYPALWFGWLTSPRYGDFGKFSGHLRFIGHTCRRLARSSFHGMLIYQAKLENKQAFLFRLVDVANELFAMSASIVRWRSMDQIGHPDAENAAELVELVCRNGRRRIGELFRQLWRNDDALKYRTARGILDGKQRWMEDGLVQMSESTVAKYTDSETPSA